MDSSKLKNWTRLLLDTGKRNNLVNFKDLSKSTVEVLLPNVAALFSKADTDYTIPVYDPELDYPKESQSTAPLLLDLEKRTPQQKKNKYLERHVLATRKKLLVYNDGNPMDAIENLEKKARFFFEETGLHVAYMVFGFILWGDFDPKETQTPPNKAPLLLAPINIEWNPTQGRYFVHFTGDDPFLNPTFAFKMESELGIVLPEYNGEPFHDYVKKVQELVENDKYKQRVSPDCKIGLFSFQKINMYRDLTDNAVAILANENVRRLLSKEPMTTDQSAKRLDNPLIELQNVVDADSSQLEAIEKARAGISFVLQGPPGTGKSQTITNIVAELLGLGKKVLFVSEKQAALNVVYDKLCKAGLGEFCLELHSHKANKKEVVSELCKTLRTPKSGISSKADQEIRLKESAMRQLDVYVDELHKSRPIVGKSAYELYEDYSSLRNAPIVDWTIPDLASYDEEKLQDVLLLLKEYAAYVPFVGEDYKSNPWNGLNKSDSSLQKKREVQNAIDSLFQLVRELPQPLEEASRLYGIAAVNLLDAYNVSLLLELLSKAREINVPLLDASKRNLVARSIRALDAQSLTVKTIQEPLDALFDERVFSLNGKENRERLVRLYDGFFYRLLSSGSGASSQNSKELRDAVDALLLLVDEIQESLNEIARLYDIRCATLIDVYNIYHLFPILSKTKALGPKFLNASILERVARELTEMDEQKAKLQESREAIDALFDKEIYELDGKDSRLRLVRLYSGFFTRLFNSEYKSLSKKLRLYKRDGQKLSYQDEIDAMEKLECFQENAAAFDARVESMGEFVAPSVLENDDARKALKEALNQLVKFNGPQTPLGRLPRMSDQEFEEERATLARVASSFEASFKKYAAQISYASKSFKLSSFKIQNASPWYREFANTLDLYQRDGKKLSYMEQIDAMEKLEEYQKNVKQFNDQAESLDAFVSPSLLKNDDSRSSLKTSLEKLSLLCDQNVPLGRLPKMNLAEFEEERGKFERLAGALGKAFQASDSVIFRAEDYFDRAKLDIQRDPREKVERRVDACRKSLGADVNAIDEWIHFETHILPPLAAHNLLPFVDAAISANIPCQDVADAFQRLCREEQIESIIASTPELSRFNQISQDQTVQIFSEKDSAQFSVNKARLRAFLSSLRPSSEYVVPGSEVHTLLREGEKKRKQKSIRVLLSEISDLALLLKPCFLMSPLSVSTFLAGDSLHFDTVVFDEASQIFPQDALGSIYRADQLIVVGDSKQMPPSNFFNASNDSDLDEDEDDESGVYESVLDLCATSLPVQSLSWHYRSRHESLIAFSNKNFYESKLVSFPSTLRQHEGIGVDYYYVENGTFDRKLRHNYKEASLVVDLIYRHFKETPKRSLGIVAFSQSQQKLIERLLKQRRLKEQDKEEFFRSDVPEPFFVKNLETVQGDERDTIIFSVAYAKGTDGKFLHNFGPLNRQKGERRLNVAVTRAKLNVKVVASIRGSDINLDQAKSDGAKLLREYLEYAEKGIDALNVETPQETLYDSTDDFVDEVYDALVEKGYRVDKRVGASGLKIDLAIKIPDADDYFFAVECDGEAYRRSKNARDRDRLRQEVLERSGWRYYRLWSTEWFKNRGRSLERLLHAMEEALTTRSSAPSSAPIAVPTNASDDVPSFEEKVDGSDDDHFPRYRAADVDAIIARFPGELQKIVHAILEVEAPLSEELLIKRIVGYFGREKVTSVVLQEYESQMTGHQRLNIYKQNGFLYLETSGPLSLRAPGDLKRDVVQIAPQEIAAGMMQLIQENVSLDKTSLYQGILRICEARMSQGVRERLDSALQLLGNRVVVEGERVSIPQ